MAAAAGHREQMGAAARQTQAPKRPCAPSPRSASAGAQAHDGAQPELAARHEPDAHAQRFARASADAEYERRSSPRRSVSYWSGSKRKVEAGKRKLHECGIAPPGASRTRSVCARASIDCPPAAAARRPERLSASAPPHAMLVYRCLACREPFEHFQAAMSAARAAPRRSSRSAQREGPRPMSGLHFHPLRIRRIGAGRPAIACIVQL